MRIVFLLTQDLESPSGLGRYLPLARQLVCLGHQVKIVALHSDYQSLTSKTDQVDGVGLEYVAPMHVKKIGNNKQYFDTFGLLKVTTQATWKLTVSIIGKHADILHVCKPHPMNSFAGIVGRSIRQTHFLCVDCDDYEAGSMLFSHAWQRWVVSCFEKNVPRAAKLVTVNTQFMHQKLLDWGIREERILDLPNGVDIGNLIEPHPGEVEELRRSLGLDGKLTIAYIGSMSLPSHPVDLLLRAFKILSKKIHTARLLLVGGGGDYEKIVDMTTEMGIQDEVIFTGRVSPEKVPLYYRVSDVSVDPVFDNDAARGRSPLKLFESWAHEVPFITSAVGDRSILIAGSQGGLLTDSTSPESYSKAMEAVLTNTSLADELRRSGKVKLQEFTWERLAVRLEQAYLNLLKTVAK